MTDKNRQGVQPNIVAGVEKIIFHNVPFSHMSCRFGDGNITYSALFKIIHIENWDIKYMR